VFPLADVLDFKVDPDVYRMVVGVVELVCGVILAMIPGTACWSIFTLQVSQLFKFTSKLSKYSYMFS